MRKPWKQVKKYMLAEVPRSCKKCGVAFTQKLINNECPFCGANQNEKLVSHKRELNYEAFKNRVSHDAHV